MKLLRENPLIQFLALGLAVLVVVAAINALLFAGLNSAIAAGSSITTRLISVAKGPGHRALTAMLCWAHY